jgi:hypothetical protein
MHYLLFYLLLFFAVFRYATFRFGEFATDAYVHFAKAAPYDVIIVPGSPYDSAEQNQMFRTRILWAQSLYNRGLTHHIIYSGSAAHTPYIEGVVMKIISDSLGIPSQCTFAETNALHSDENITYSYALAKKMGFKKIAAASDPFQIFFLRKHIEQNFPGIALLPMPLDTFRKFAANGNLPSIDASVAMVENFVPLKERDRN